MFSVHDRGLVSTLAGLSKFRDDVYGCLTARADALFELCDVVLCVQGPVRSLAELSLVPEYRRGHGALYDAINCGRVEVTRLRLVLAGLALPRAADGRLVLAVDVSPWLRPDAATCPDRCSCHTFGRRASEHQMIPGWPYSVIVALETGRSSWTAPLDAQRLAPGADVLAVTCAQIRDVTGRLVEAGQWRTGDPDILIVLDAGYDGPRLAWLLADLPVQVLVRLRSDRVFARPAPPYLFRPDGGRPARHGGQFVFKDPATWGEHDIETRTDTRLYGMTTALAWNRLHPRLQRRSAWANWVGPMPILEGTVIRLTVERLPSGGVNKPVWLWWSGTDATPADVDRCWRMFLRRFDIEHTFRMWKQTLGWTRPQVRDPEAADRWTLLILTAYTQLRLSRSLVEDLRLPWEKPVAPQRLTPARVRRGFRH
ncbi:transposase, partial [Nocardia terpenica]|uniref:NF041680 family putative transposase n=1 Tax=Nocardia terpenica TaxID=455432 RepID=UPI002FE207B8